MTKANLWHIRITSISLSVKAEEGITACWNIIKPYSASDQLSNSYLRHLKLTRREIACHPMGGPILFLVMAAKANMSSLGRHVLLITKEYGPRWDWVWLPPQHPLAGETSKIYRDWRILQKVWKLYKVMSRGSHSGSAVEKGGVWYCHLCGC